MNIKNFLVTFFVLFYFKLYTLNDLTLMAPMVVFNDGWGRFSIGLIETLKNDLKINFIKTANSPIVKTNISEETLKIIKNQNRKISSNVIIIVDFPHKCKRFINSFPKKSIAFTYTMFETSSIPKDWVDILNLFDGACVPDEYLKQMYKKCGVSVPIFVLPLGIYLNEFLSIEAKRSKNRPFIFGNLGFMQPRKNLDLLVKAFAAEFKNSKDVKLILNSRLGAFDNCEKKLQNLIKTLNLSNVELSLSTFTWKDYIKKMKSFDCYVNIAKGEGFSIPPREALALGIPCILSNNTAQMSICNTEFVRSILSDLLEPATSNYYPELFGVKTNLGYFFNSKIEDVRKALRDVYKNYDIYLKKASQGREWTKQFDWQNVKQKYLNLIKPKKVILGDENIINDDFIMTNSIKLFNKYQAIKGN